MVKIILTQKITLEAPQFSQADFSNKRKDELIIVICNSYLIGVSSGFIISSRTLDGHSKVLSQSSIALFPIA